MEGQVNKGAAIGAVPRTDDGQIICPVCGQANGSLYCGKCDKCVRQNIRPADTSKEGE